MRTIGNKLKAKRLDDDRVDGFLIERIRDDRVDGRFVERYLHQDVFYSALGIPEAVERTAYRFTEFSLFTDPQVIEIRDSPRSTKGFTSRLTEVCNFNLVLSNSSVDLNEWIDAIRELAGSRPLVESLDAELRINGGVDARITLSGKSDVRRSLNALIGARRYTLDKVQLKVFVGSEMSSIHLTSSVTAKFSSDLASDVLPIIRESLSRLSSVHGHI